mmetsp:Transcript_30670/g.74889  ORF Transcript_30670/g.74889 Transcript_30670/m.74889 type:complete len:207 (-) Transcript_30670:690-1310(-)
MISTSFWSPEYRSAALSLVVYCYCRYYCHVVAQPLLQKHIVEHLSPHNIVVLLPPTPLLLLQHPPPIHRLETFHHQALELVPHYHHHHYHHYHQSHRCHYHRHCRYQHQASRARSEQGNTAPQHCQRTPSPPAVLGTVPLSHTCTRLRHTWCASHSNRIRQQNQVCLQNNHHVHRSQEAQCQCHFARKNLGANSVPTRAHLDGTDT